nr:glucosaminidase domain-containing protein [Pedobacter sp. ASV19]
MIKKLMYIWTALLFTFTASKAQTTLDYINENVDHAQELMRASHIPASVILAVAIHESASGTSKIARYLNNHFGVKGQNSSKEIHSAYKDYPSVQDSYNHFVEFLESKASFSSLFDKFDESDYVGWAKGIQKGGYARSRSWSSQVIGLIKKYELFKYDQRPQQYLEAVFPIPSLAGKITKQTVHNPDN